MMKKLQERIMRTTFCLHLLESLLLLLLLQLKMIFRKLHPACMGWITRNVLLAHAALWLVGFLFSVYNVLTARALQRSVSAPPQ